MNRAAYVTPGLRQYIKLRGIRNAALEPNGASNYYISYRFSNKCHRFAGGGFVQTGEWANWTGAYSEITCCQQYKLHTI